jgi:hypothetical protein
MPKVAFTDGLKTRRGLSWHKSNSGAFWIGLALAKSDERGRTCSFLHARA